MPPASAATCEKVEDQIDYRLKNRNNLYEALHADTSQRAFFGRLIEEANKKLGLIGHAVMNLAVFERAYDAERPLSTSQMKDHASRVGTSYNLSAKGRKAGLAECLQHGGDVEAITDQMMATAVEAILGAVWRDSKDLAVVKGVMVKLSLFEALSPLDRD